MSDLLKQANRADTLADQTVDEELKNNLRDAAKQYRAKARDKDKARGELCEPKPEWQLPQEIS